MVIKDVISVWWDVKEHALFTKISFFNIFSIAMHFISLFIEKKMKKKKENLIIRENEFSRNIWNDLIRKNLFSQILENLTIREN